MLQAGQGGAAYSGSQVVLTARTSEGDVPDWEELQARSEAMWRRQGWARGVAVDNASTRPGCRLLSRSMQARHLPPCNAWSLPVACSLCRTYCAFSTLDTG